MCPAGSGQGARVVLYHKVRAVLPLVRLTQLPALLYNGKNCPGGAHVCCSWVECKMNAMHDMPGAVMTARLAMARTCETKPNTSLIHFLLPPALPAII